MNQEEKAEVLAYLEKFNSVFNEVAKDVTKKVLSSQVSQDVNPFSQGEKYFETVSGSFTPSSVQVDPKLFLAQQWQFWEKQQQLWQSTVRAMLGEQVEPLIQEDKGDNRFADGDWQGNPAFNYVKQAYLLNADYLNGMIKAFRFEDEKLGEQLQFFMRQMINSMSPSNYVFTNPEVCREILSSEGECLAKGLDNLMRDLEQSPSEAFKITQVNIDAFELGKTLAYTPGKVVYKNDLIELIQYSPSTKVCFEVPLLIIPPFINKFYILDLNEKKSLVRWLVDQGFTVFMVSWVNPGEDHSNTTFDHYVQDGVIAALDAVEDICGQSKINVAGYCVGGTLLAIAQAYLQSKGDKRIQSLTFLTTLLDFSEPGEIGNYIASQSLPVIEQSVASKGYMDGRVLALGFSLLRENNLFWSFFIENYLKGKDPVPFDILYWNSDSTNIPAPTYLFYLKNMYVENVLREPGAIKVFGQPIDLSKIEIPSYNLAAIGDHIVLWSAAYRSCQLLGGDKRFVLTESGHVAGVVNPASRNKYGYWSDGKNASEPGEWFSSAGKSDRSWWHDWSAWLQQRAGEQLDAPTMGSKKYAPISDAPGEYVKQRLEQRSHFEAKKNASGSQCLRHIPGKFCQPVILLKHPNLNL